MSNTTKIKGLEDKENLLAQQNEIKQQLDQAILDNKDPLPLQEKMRAVVDKLGLLKRKEHLKKIQAKERAIADRQQQNDYLKQKQKEAHDKLTEIIPQFEEAKKNYFELKKKVENLRRDQGLNPLTIINDREIRELKKEIEELKRI